MKKYIAIIAAAIMAASCTKTNYAYVRISSEWLQDQSAVLDRTVLRMPLFVIETALGVNLDNDTRKMNSREGENEYYSSGLGRFITNGKELSEDGAEWKIYALQDYMDGEPLVVRGHGSGEYSISFVGTVPEYSHRFEDGAVLSYEFRLRRKPQVVGAVDQITVTGTVTESEGYFYKLEGKDLVARNISFTEGDWNHWSGTLSGEFTMSVMNGDLELDFVTRKY